MNEERCASSSVCHYTYASPNKRTDPAECPRSMFPPKASKQFVLGLPFRCTSDLSLLGSRVRVPVSPGGYLWWTMSGFLGVFKGLSRFYIFIPPTLSILNSSLRVISYSHSFISRHHLPHSWLGKIIGMAHHQCKNHAGWWEAKRGSYHVFLHLTQHPA